MAYYLQVYLALFRYNELHTMIFGNKKFQNKFMKINIEFPRKLLEVYNDACKPLCKKLKLPQTAFDILMFLGNNPQYQTARDIVKIRNIKANLISINVEKLVKEGYLRREEI